MKNINKGILFMAFIMLLTISCKNDKKDDASKEVETPTEVIPEKEEEVETESSAIAHKFNKETFNFSITGYGAKDKSYAVSDIVFKKFVVNSPKDQLLGAILSLDPNSIDTSRNLNNGQGGEWPVAFAEVRNGNIINGFFNNLTVKENVTAEIISVDEAYIDLKVTLNGVSKTIKMAYIVDVEDLLSATGKIDVLDFNTRDAFKKFSELCSVAFHQGKTWSEIGLKFTVKTN